MTSSAVGSICWEAAGAARELVRGEQASLHTDPHLRLNCEGGDVERRPRSRALVNASGLLALRGQVPFSHSHLVGWFFRVIEAGDGRWVCRRGRTELDGHAQLQDAIEHLRTLAGHEVHAELFVHHQDGTVERIHSTDGRRLASMRGSP